jgi:excinuclease ABC subunit A
VLYARAGHRPCPACGKDVPPSFGQAGAEWESEAAGDADAPEEAFPCPHCGAPIPEIGMANFSFNKPAGACPACTGLGAAHQADLKRLVDEHKSISQGAVLGWNLFHINYNTATLKAAAAHYGFAVDFALPVSDYTPPQSDLLYFGVDSPRFRRHFPSITPPVTVRGGRFEGVATSLLRRHAAHLDAHRHDADYVDKLEDFLVTGPCPECEGTRLRSESRAVTVCGQTIVAASRLPLAELGAWLGGLGAGLSRDERAVAKPVLAALRERISRLVEAGVPYLTLERPSATVSAGEAQRLRLASLLGSALSGLLYVFDEPTVGLHARDTRRLIDILRRLRDLGNTVLVIEHDLSVIAAADHVVDFGPGGGKRGGQVVAAGAPAEVAAEPASLTGGYLAGRVAVPAPTHRRAPGGKSIDIRGARHHNLRDITVSVPLGLLVAVTGVSGSGKSSLVFDILDRALRQRLYGSGEAAGEHDAIEGVEYLDKVITIDQGAIGRIPRSNAATYTEVFTPIRETFAVTAEARRRGLAARHFSFNVAGGRCERCEGAGVLTVHMQLLPDMEVRCPVCHGRRFTGETLAVRYREHDISQVLDLTVEEALELFQDVPAARSRLQVLCDVGLGYLQLGQPATTLSGGEAQRVKLAKELGRRASGRTLVLLDEPTTGLHPADTARLLDLLQRLVDLGNSVVVVEHNLDLIRAADWVIDLGPEGGDGGGRLLAVGTPEQIARARGSHTGRSLKGYPPRWLT